MMKHGQWQSIANLQTSLILHWLNERYISEFWTLRYPKVRFPTLDFGCLSDSMGAAAARLYWHALNWHHSFFHLFISFVIHSFFQSIILSFFIHSFISFIHSFIIISFIIISFNIISFIIISFIHSFIHSSIHPSIHSFIQSFIHSFIQSWLIEWCQNKSWVNALMTGNRSPLIYLFNFDGKSTSVIWLSHISACHLLTNNFPGLMPFVHNVWELRFHCYPRWNDSE